MGVPVRKDARKPLSVMGDIAVVQVVIVLHTRERAVVNRVVKDLENLNADLTILGMEKLCGKVKICSKSYNTPAFSGGVFSKG